MTLTFPVDSAEDPGRVVCWTRSFPGTPDQAREARRWVSHFVPDAIDAGEVAVCVSEEFTNALFHTASGLPGGWVEVSVVDDPHAGQLTVCVTDQGTREVPAPQVGREGGRGMGIVAVYASSVCLQGVGTAPRTVRITFSYARVSTPQDRERHPAPV